MREAIARKLGVRAQALFEVSGVGLRPCLPHRRPSQRLARSPGRCGGVGGVCRTASTVAGHSVHMSDHQMRPRTILGDLA